MPKEFNNYDPSAIVLIFGELTISGFAKGTFVKVSFNNPSFKHEKGAQGDGVRTAVLDFSGTIEFTLNGTAACNSKLSTIARSDRRNGDGVKPTEVKDTKGETTWHGENAWIEMTAAAEFADDHTPRDWKIIVDDINDAFTGGSLR
jgi:hypothetical protein